MIRLALLISLLVSTAFAQYTPFGAVFPVTVAGPTVTYVGGCVASSATLTANCTLSPSSTSGNFLQAVSKTQNTSGTAVPVFTSNSGPVCTWVLAMPATPIATGSPGNSTVWTCLLPSSGAENVKITWTGVTGSQFTDLAVSEYHSTATWNNPVLDRSIFTAHTTSTTSCASGTTALATQNANDLLIGICENFNNAQTWGALSGWATHAVSNRNTTGIYDQTVATIQSPSVTIPLSVSDTSTGFLIAYQASNAVNCSGCALVQSAESAGQTGQFDHIALSGVVPGDTLVYYVFHNNWSGSGTTTMSDNNGNIWFKCNTNTGGAASVTMTDLQGPSTGGMSCFYSIAVGAGGTVTGQPTATDCAVSCTFIGGVFMEFKGVHAWEAFSNTAAPSVSSTTSPNNLNCGSITTTTANDLIICGTNPASGTPTAGTVPLSFTLFNTTNGAMEDGIWSSTGTTSPTESLAASGVAYGGMAVAFR